jgi:hypothetical protein
MSQPETKNKPAAPDSRPRETDTQDSKFMRPTYKDVLVPREAGSRERPKEIGGPKGPEPTRYGDWEKNGRCIDF